jgi:hypothetical protein
VLTEAETADMHKMVNELEATADAGGPGSLAAWLKMRWLADATGDQWEATVKMLLSERARNLNGVNDGKG